MNQLKILVHYFPTTADPGQIINHLNLVSKCISSPTVIDLIPTKNDCYSMLCFELTREKAAYKVIVIGSGRIHRGIKLPVSADASKLHIGK